ncbi:hypothetical protein [Roseiflexus sp.]
MIWRQAALGVGRTPLRAAVRSLLTMCVRRERRVARRQTRFASDDARRTAAGMGACAAIAG